ncbi:MAG: aminoacyl-histidine dipeptidase [Acidobacteria bacterium]|nr:aminoacyl-histidine dipeptidase [Acidobacteriota bacterium]
MTFVSALEPKPVWSHFDTILTIPRASKDEERMRRHVIAAAGAAGCDHVVDDAGNVVVRKAATAGHEGAPVTILQSHLDMVQEKNADVAFDFGTDAIVPRREGAHLYATGTTLGSDNGIGVAAMLAVMDSTDLAHGPLELLFTIDEETGLTGAAQLDASLLSGRRLINLDSEEEGILYVGCAGGGDMRLSLGVTAAGTGGGDRALTVALRGLKGGHSGCEIHLQRGNAVCLLARALWAAHAGAPFRLARLEGGSAHNAIPREAFATIVAAASDVDSIASAMRAEFESFREEYRPADPGMTLDIGDAAAASRAWEADATATVLRLISSLPHGVEAMSYDIPGLVETSNNVATVKGANGSLVITTSSRSSVDAELDALRRRIRATGELAGANVDVRPAYPGWKPNMESEVLEVVKQVHARELGKEPKVAAIHAGLECGIIGKKIPGMDMISFGPVIEAPHSPDERVHIDSVGRFYRLLTATLAELA